MKTVFHPASERGHMNFGWLDTHHSFSFGQWHHPEKIHFGALRVLNDDKIHGGTGFPLHPHDNMEIVTIPLSGAVAHKDSMGSNGIIYSGDIQIMSAGRGVKHSEYNASDTDILHLLQIWVFPKHKNIDPRYDQRSFDVADRLNKWQIVVSPDEEKGSLWINQDAVFALTDLHTGTAITYEKKFSGNGVYFFVIEGDVQLQDKLLSDKDAIGIWNTDDVIALKANSNAKLLAVEIPMTW